MANDFGFPTEGEEGSSSGEHALLESLFYNEMMMMESDSMFALSLPAAAGAGVAADGKHSSSDNGSKQTPSSTVTAAAGASAVSASGGAGVLGGTRIASNLSLASSPYSVAVASSSSQHNRGTVYQQSQQQSQQGQILPVSLPVISHTATTATSPYLPLSQLHSQSQPRHLTTQQQSNLSQQPRSTSYALPRSFSNPNTQPTPRTSGATSTASTLPYHHLTHSQLQAQSQSQSQSRSSTTQSQPIIPTTTAAKTATHPYTNYINAASNMQQQQQQQQIPLSQSLPVPTPLPIPTNNNTSQSTNSNSTLLLNSVKTNQPSNHTTNNNNNNNHNPEIDPLKSKQLVKQFQMLASRLGIALPNNVLSKLPSLSSTNSLSSTTTIPTSNTRDTTTTIPMTTTTTTTAMSPNNPIGGTTAPSPLLLPTNSDTTNGGGILQPIQLRTNTIPTNDPTMTLASAIKIETSINGTNGVTTSSSSRSIAANGVGRGRCSSTTTTAMPASGSTTVVGSGGGVSGAFNTKTIINQLQETTEAAITDVNNRGRKRSRSDLSKNSGCGDDGCDATNTNSTNSHHPNNNHTNSTTNATGNKWQAKRKKKPRKEDCEVRLKQLKDENEMLKRHLDHVTNKSTRFYKERKLAEEKMKELVFHSRKVPNVTSSIIPTVDPTEGIMNQTTTATTMTTSMAVGSECGLPGKVGGGHGSGGGDDESTSTTGDYSLNSSASSTADREEKLKEILGHFSDTYSDYGKHRQEELTFHLNQLEKLAAPTTFTKMTLWTLGQNKSFFTQPQTNPIAGILMREMDISPSQGRKILAQRETTQRLCSNIKSCLQLIAELKALCARKQTVFHDRMTKCQEILTTEQVAKLVIWIDEHGAVLENVCPGWGSERIRSGKRGRGGGKKIDTVL